MNKKRKAVELLAVVLYGIVVVLLRRYLRQR